MEPPPPPPPHGSTPGREDGLPPGNYDIFIIPPHSAGNGFLYLPSLRPNTNSFIAGAASAFFLCWLYSLVIPTLKQVFRSITQSGNGPAMICFVAVVGAGAWYMGKMQQMPHAHSGGSAGAGPGTQHQPPPPPPPQNGYPRGGPNPHAAGGAGYQGGPQGAGYQGNAQGAGGPGWGSTPGGAYGHQQHHYTHTAPPPQPPKTEPYGARSESDSSERPKPRARSYSDASNRWQKAREETRKREEERKVREEAEKRKAEKEREARLAAERERMEKIRQRDKENKEREARDKESKEREARERENKEREAREKAEKERLEKAEKERLEKSERERLEKAAKEKLEREARAQAARERIEQERLEKAKSEKAPTSYGVGERTNPYSIDNVKVPTPAAAAAQKAASNAAERTPYERPSAHSYVGTATEESFRPYDKARPKHAGSGSSFYSTYSESYAPSQSTAHTSPPPSHRGPYSTKDPEKIIILGVYQFTDSFPKPKVSLVAGQNGWSDGIVLKINSEGFFLDDDVKGVGMREWDMKAWGLKSVETTSKNGFYIVRATIRDQENKRCVFIIAESEEWKVTQGLKRLKNGSLVQQRFAWSTMIPSEATKVLALVDL